MTLAELRTLLDSLAEHGLAENLPVFMATGANKAATGSVCARLTVVEGKPALMLYDEQDTPQNGFDEYHQANTRMTSHVEYHGVLPGKEEGCTVPLVTDLSEPGNPRYVVSDKGRLLRENQDGTFTDLNFSGRLYVIPVNQQTDGYWNWWLHFDRQGNFTEATEVPEYAFYTSGRPGTLRDN